jgi:hypothetical protein
MVAATREIWSSFVRDAFWTDKESSVEIILVIIVRTFSLGATNIYTVQFS